MQRILKEQIVRLRPDPIAFTELRKLADVFLDAVTASLKRLRVDAEAFIGGSFARGTFLKSDRYDVDIFVRFNWKYENLSDMLEKVLSPVCSAMSLRLERIHGSRDYFRAYNGSAPGYFEIIPVTKIKKPQEERNVTDLSYFHVPYVKKRIRGLEDQVRLTKKFFKAQGVYGAETYVRGFSGYTVELLIIYYKSFLKLLRGLLAVKDGERTVIDSEHHYTRKNEVFIHMNEAKLHSPIILVDPTYKERNALAALSTETFKRLQTAARAFLKKPSERFFEPTALDVPALTRKATKKKCEFISFVLTTDKQAGDIAGTKLKKFYDFLLAEIGHYFILDEDYFMYNCGTDAQGYLLLKPKKEVVRIGPPLAMKKHVARFKAEHLNTFVKGKHIHARIPVTFNARSYTDSWLKANEKTLREMHIISLQIVD